MFKTKTKPVTPPNQKADKKRYECPTFTVIPLNIEAPLLSGSGTQPIQSPINPVTPGGLW